MMVATIVLWCLPRPPTPRLSPALDRGAHRRRAILGNEAAFFCGGEQVIDHVGLLQFATGNQLRQAERGTVERIVAPAILRHSGKLVAFIPQRSPAVDRGARTVSPDFGGNDLRDIWRLAVLRADLNPSGAPHDLAGLGNEPARKRPINERQVFMRDVEQLNVLGPAIGLLGVFVNSFGNELLAIGQDLDLMHGAVRRLERRAHFLERGDAAERNQALGWLANALENCAAARDHVEQRLLHFISDLLIADIDIEAWRIASANAGAQFARTLIGPCRYRIEVRRCLFPSRERGALATRQDRDRLVAAL